MKHFNVATRAGLFLGVYMLGTLLSGCIVAEPREGYWDREHARYYHHHVWVNCNREDEHCR